MTLSTEVAGVLEVGGRGPGVEAAEPKNNSSTFVRSCASAASGNSREQKVSIHQAPAERHEAPHSALFPGRRWPAASWTAWQYWGQKSGESMQPTCMCTGVSSLPPQWRHVCGRTATPESRSFCMGAEPALHPCVAVPGPQRLVVGGRAVMSRAWT